MKIGQANTGDTVTMKQDSNDLKKGDVVKVIGPVIVQGVAVIDVRDAEGKPLYAEPDTECELAGEPVKATPTPDWSFAPAAEEAGDNANDQQE